MKSPDKKFTNFLVNNFFRNLKTGFFIEVGANTGYEGSVCWHLEKDYGWSGMNIECNPYCFPDLIKNRPSCININRALSDEKGELTFIFPTDGPRKLFAGQGSVVFNHNHWAKRPTKEIVVKADTLLYLLALHNIKAADLLVLDVEGYELSALNGLYGSKIIPRVIVVEDSKIDIDKLNDIMKKLGLKQFSRRYKNNRIYYVDI